MSETKKNGDALVRIAEASGSDLPDMEDEQLVQSYLQSDRRDEHLFRELLRRCQRQVWLICMRYLGRADDADDMSQEVFLQVYRQLPKYRGEARVRQWIRRIAENMCKNELRRLSRRPREDTAEEVGSNKAVDPEPGPETTALSREKLRRLANALSRLDATERRLLNRATEGDIAHTDLTRELGISRGALKMRLLRIRLRLRENLEQEEKELAP